MYVPALIHLVAYRACTDACPDEGARRTASGCLAELDAHARPANTASFGRATPVPLLVLAQPPFRTNVKQTAMTTKTFLIRSPSMITPFWFKRALRLGWLPTLMPSHGFVIVGDINHALSFAHEATLAP